MNTETINLVKEYISRKSLKGLSEGVLLKKKNKLFDLFLFLEKPLQKITEEDLKSFVERESKGLSNNTYNWHIGFLKDFFKYLMSENKLLLNPCCNLTGKKEKSRNHLGVFTEDEVRRIIKAVPLNSKLGIRDRAMIELMYSTGIRVGEFTALNVSDINFNYRELAVYNGKGDTERILPVGLSALDALEEYLKVRDQFMYETTDREALFLSLKRERISVDSVRGAIKRYKKKAGVSARGSSHALRHSMATHMLKRGADIKDVARMLGHVKLENTQIYTHLLDEDIKESFNKSHPKAGRKHDA